MATGPSRDQHKEYDHLFKLLLIGDSGVGKTSVLFRYCEDRFNSTFINTLGVDFRIKTIDLDGKKIKLQIWDTAGQERFRTVITSYFRGAKGILLVYDITDAKTFENVTKWLGNIDAHAASDVQTMLLGNKCDLDSKRVVVMEDGQRLADSQSIAFMETSAKSNVNISKAFTAMAQSILDNSKDPNMQQGTILRPTAGDQGNKSSSDGEKRKCCKSS